MDYENPEFARVPANTLYENVVDSLVRGFDDDGGITVLVIDGKAAAGKSTWAGKLARGLQNRGRNASILQADWFLKDRNFRDSQMQSLQKSKDPAWGVLVPAEFHLGFWDWTGLNDAVEEARALAESGADETLELKGIYNRKTGKCDGVEEIKIRAGSVLIIPGSYVLSRLAQDLIDRSILLYVSKEEGRRRKLSREMEKGEFPNGDRIGNVISTWELIEEPSFLRHMLRSGDLANVVVDNSDHVMPSVVKFELKPSLVVGGPVRTRGSIQPSSGTNDLVRFVRRGHPPRARNTCDCSPTEGPLN